MRPSLAAGFAHKNQASNIDLNVVRLCFQVFIEGPETGQCAVPLRPIVCDPIYDKKAMSELVITKLSHCSAPVSGGMEVILLCDRVTKDDIQIRFFEESQGRLVWEAFADFQPNDVHKQVAISFRTPKYCMEGIHSPVSVQIQLRRPSDGHCSDPRPFQFYPRDVDPDGLSRKRQKVSEVDFDRFVLASPPQPPEQLPFPLAPNPVPEFVRVPRFAPKVKHETSEGAAAAAAMWSQSQSQEPPPAVFGTMASGLMDQASAAVKKEEPDRPTERGVVDGHLTEKLDSLGLDLDIDASDLMNDINFNNLMVNLDSGNNITFNSSGNIADAGLQAASSSLPFASSAYATLNTPQGLEDSRHPLSHFSNPSAPS